MHDPLCMGVAVDPGIVKKMLSMKMNVEYADDAQTKGMCIVDGRRWRTKEEPQASQPLIPSVDGKGPQNVNVVVRVDNDRFFKRFMQYVFGVEWNQEVHSWRELDADDN